MRPSARLMNSTGTSHRRPDLVSGAGNDTRRPDTEASAWSGVSTTVLSLYNTVTAPASVSSRNVTLKVDARSSSAISSWPPTRTVGSGRRPSGVRRTSGAGGAEPWPIGAAAQMSAKSRARLKPTRWRGNTDPILYPERLSPVDGHSATPPGSDGDALMARLAAVDRAPRVTAGRWVDPSLPPLSDAWKRAPPAFCLSLVRRYRGSACMPAVHVSDR